MPRYRIPPQAKHWRRIRLADVEGYSKNGPSTTLRVRGQVAPAEVHGDHVAALDAYFAEQVSA